MSALDGKILYIYTVLLTLDAMSSALSIQHVWHADQLDVSPMPALSSGYSGLDRELPNGGWPQAALIELLPRQDGIGELRLLQPALARIAPQRPIALVHPPCIPQVAAWANWGLAPPQLLWVKPARNADALWAAEQILRNGSCGALLLWQSQLRSDCLRRLHLAAQSSDTLFWLLRPLAAAAEASPAPLRLALHPTAGGLHVEFLKRRGPPRDTPLFVPLAHMPAAPSPQTPTRHAHVDRRPSTPAATRSPASTLV